MTTRQCHLLSLPDELLQEIALSLDGNDIKELLQIQQLFLSLKEIIRIELPKGVDEFAVLPYISRRACKEIHWRKRLPKKYIYCIQIDSAKDLISPFFKTRLPTIGSAKSLILLNFKWDKEDKLRLGDKHKSRSIQTQFNRSHLTKILNILPVEASIYMANRDKAKLNLDLEDSSFFQRETGNFDFNRDVFLLCDVKDLRITVQENDVRFFKKFFSTTKEISYCEIKCENQYFHQLEMSGKFLALVLEDTTEFAAEVSGHQDEKKRKINEDSTFVSSTIGYFQKMSFERSSFPKIKSFVLQTRSPTIAHLRLNSCLHFKVEFLSNNIVPTIKDLVAEDLVLFEISYNGNHIRLEDVKANNLRALSMEDSKEKSYTNSQLPNKLWCFPKIESLKLKSVYQLDLLSDSTKLSLKQLQHPVTTLEECQKLKEYCSFMQIEQIIVQTKDELCRSQLKAIKDHSNLKDNMFILPGDESSLQVNQGLFPSNINDQQFKELVTHWMKIWFNKYDDSHRRKSKMEIIDQRRDLMERFKIKSDL